MKRLVAILILFFPLMIMTKVIDNLDNERVEWLPFSDRVMGGISEINFSVQEYNGKVCIRSGLSNIKNIGHELSKFIRVL